MKKLINQFLRFAVVGGTAFIVDLAIYTLLSELIFPACFQNISVKQCAMVSKAISFTISTVYNYILSIKLVFAKRTDTSSTQTFGIFVILSLIALALTELFLFILISLKLHHMIANIISTALVMVYNFISRKIFIEDHSQEKSE